MTRSASSWAASHAALATVDAARAEPSVPRTMGGSLIQVMATAAMASRTPAKVMALLGSSPSTFVKIGPNVTVWMSIGTTIIMLMIPMYNPVARRRDHARGHDVGHAHDRRPGDA